MKRALIFTLSVLLFSCSLFASESDSLSHRLQSSLLVMDPVKAALELCEWAESRGGYFLSRSSEGVIVRFPKASLGEFEEYLEAVSEIVLNKTQDAQDLSDRIVEYRSGIGAREEILNRNLSFLDRADVKGTLAIEKEVAALLKEIDNLKGKLRKAETDTRMVYAHISLTFLRPEIPEKIPSSFPWINTLDFYRFMEGGLR